MIRPSKYKIEIKLADVPFDSVFLLYSHEIDAWYESDNNQGPLLSGKITMARELLNDSPSFSLFVENEEDAVLIKLLL